MLTHDKKMINFFVSWLTISLLLVFLIIVIGGLTRLTNSGLSITEWELFSGLLPPLTQSKWDEYFNLYKDIPQYKILYSTMSLEEFKIIFYWEYVHRILGRLIGLVFLIPLVYFTIKKDIKIKFLIPYYIILALIILQGIIGWYMVQSGLVNNVTVSHYRLSMHLGVAIIIISIIFWQILNLKGNTSKKFFNFSKKNIPFILLFVLIFIQIIFGALVSGLDAGRIYQTWPLMGFNYFPDDFMVMNLKNLINFENHSLVQFYHRNLAYLIILYVLLISYFIFKNKIDNLYTPTILLLVIVSFQVLLGIYTLLSGLNIAIASGHQISSVVLILSVLYLYYSRIK